MNVPLPMTPDDIVREAEALGALLNREYVEEGQDPLICELSRDIDLFVREIRASQNAGGTRVVERRGRSSEGMLRDFRRRYDTFKETRARQQLASQRRHIADVYARIDSLERKMREGEERVRHREYERQQTLVPANLANFTFWLILLLLLCVFFAVGLLLLQLFFSGIFAARAH